MPTLFTRIINQEISSHKIYEDEYTYVFLTIEPLFEWHTLVVPKIEWDKWYDHDQTTINHLMYTAKYISKVLEKTFESPRIALIIEWLEVPHTHIHLVPLHDGKWLEDAKKTNPTTEELKFVAQKILNALHTWS